MTTPYVSIVCITYNHELYIRQCLDGFFMQKTNFEFEVLIHDDASTDKTADIIRSYEKKYPGIIRPIYQSENQYSKGINPGTFLYPMAKGKYIAVSEGDDYWTDPLKLQKQVDFLERNEDYVLTCHRYSKFDSDDNKWYSDNQEKYFLKNNQGISFSYPFKSWITKTLTLVFRRSALSNMSNYKGLMRDTILVYFLMKNGKGYCFNDNMGVYRIHSGGVVSKQTLAKIVFDSYFVLKDLYKNERNWITRRMYYSKYFSVFVTTKGKILFKEKFEFIKFLSLLYYFPIKSFRLFKRFIRVN